MRCDEAQELFGVYWDLPAQDPLRQQLQQHLSECDSCAEEFAIWQESLDLIHDMALTPTDELQDSYISKGVMDRIYAEEAWKLPVSEKVYSISYKMRRNITAVVAVCLSLFLISILYTIVERPDTPAGHHAESSSESLAVANALGSNASDGIDLDSKTLIPLASISDDPLILKMGPIETFPDYLIVLSILGLVSALLIMNWLSRIRS